MSGNIAFISRNKVKPGRLAELTQYYQEVVELIKATKPGTLTHIAYANADGTELTIIHLFPDAEAFDLHLQGVGPRSQQFYEYAETLGLEIFGEISAPSLELMTRIAAANNVPLIIWPNQIGGYIRLVPGA